MSLTESGSSVPQLPPELHEAIFSRLDEHRDLRQLCLVNSVFHDIAIRYLYRHLRLKDFRRAINACLLILRKPAVAAYVTRLDIDFGEVPDWIVHQWPAPKIFLYTFAPSYCRLMFRAFRLMKQLEHLTFKNTSPLGRLPARNLAQSGIQVRSLVLPTSVFEHVILQSQPLIEDLEIHDGPSFSIPALQRSAIPRLRSLVAFHEDAKYLVPGRPVTEFRPLDTLLEVHVPKCMEMLSKSTGPLRRIKLLMMKIDGMFFIYAARAIPDIVDLIVHSMENVEYTMVVEMQRPDVLHAFRSFHSLENLEIHSYYDRPALRYLPPITPLGRACASLQTFTIIDELRGSSDRQRLPAYQLRRQPGRVLGPDEVEWTPREGLARTPRPRAGKQVSLIEWIE